jgi:hypothetical protein
MTPTSPPDSQPTPQPAAQPTPEPTAQPAARPAARPATQQTVQPASRSVPLPATAVTALARAHAALTESAAAAEPASRYVAAHVAALRTTAALLAVRTRPALGPGRRRQRNAWTLLAQVAPELEEWAVFFAAGAAKRAAAEAGISRVVSTREADDLLRDSGRFLALVERMLGVPSRHDPSQLALPPARAS